MGFFRRQITTKGIVQALHTPEAATKLTSIVAAPALETPNLSPPEVKIGDKTYRVFVGPSIDKVADR